MDLFNFQQGIAQAEKQAGFFDLLGKAVNGGWNTFMLPGSLVHPDSGAGMGAIKGTLANLGIGAGLGAGYHHLKRKFYNTQEENEIEDQEEGNMPLLLRAGIPALALGGLGILQSSVVKPGHNSYYSKRWSGERPYF